MVFQNSPLVELITELRWVSATNHNVRGNGTIVGQTSVNSDYEQFYRDFNASAFHDNFTNIERLIPNGFPVPPSQPVFRLRHSDQPDNPSIFQLGQGLFTANVTQPYQSWEKFLPTVKTGVSNLLNSRLEDEKEVEFNFLSVRYIDAFDSDFLKDQNAIDFLSSKLGFKFELPNIISELADDKHEIRPKIQYSIRLKAEMVLNISIALGTVNKKESLIFDTAVSTTSPVKPTLDEVLIQLNKAHDIINEIFMDITKPLHSIMRPLN